MQASSRTSSKPGLFAALAGQKKLKRARYGSTVDASGNDVPNDISTPTPQPQPAPVPDPSPTPPPGYTPPDVAPADNSSSVDAGSPPDGPISTSTDIIKMIHDIALAAGIDPQYQWIPLAIAFGESGFNPDQVGDGGHSVGIYQLHDKGEGAGMGNARYDPAANIQRAMPAIAQAIHDFIDKNVVQDGRTINGSEMLHDVWQQAQRPDAASLTARVPNIYKWAEGNVIGGQGLGAQGQDLAPGTASGTGGTTGTGTDLTNLPPDELTQAQTDYYKAQAERLSAQTGIDVATLQAQIQNWDQTHAISWATLQQANDQFNQTLGLDKAKFQQAADQFDKTYGLSLQQFQETKDEFAKNFGLSVDTLNEKKKVDLATLTENLLQARLQNRQQAADSQMKLFQQIAPNSVQDNPAGQGLIAALGRMFAGVNNGGAFPTTQVPINTSLFQPADINAETAAASTAAQGMLNPAPAPAPMAKGGVVNGMFQTLDSGALQKPRRGLRRAATGTVTPQPRGTLLTIGGRQYVADGTGHLNPMDGGSDWIPDPGAAPTATPAPAPAPAPGSTSTDPSTQLILDYLSGLDPATKALATGTNSIQTLANLFGNIPPELVDQLLSTILPPGTHSGLGGQTEQAKEFALSFSLDQQKLGIAKETADANAASVANQMALGTLDANTRLQVANIQKAAQAASDAAHSGDVRYASDSQLRGQKYVADLNYSLGAAQQNEKNAQDLATLQANPRKIFEAIALQANMRPSAAAEQAQAQITPNPADFAPIPTTPPPVLASGASGGSATPPVPMAQGGGIFRQMDQPTMLVTGDKGNRGNTSRGTEEYVLAPPGTVVATSEPGEPLTMENAMKAVNDQLQHSAGGYSGGLFRAAAGDVVPGTVYDPVTGQMVPTGGHSYDVSGVTPNTGVTLNPGGGTSPVIPDVRTDPLGYLNYLRAQAGLPPVTWTPGMPMPNPNTDPTNYAIWKRAQPVPTPVAPAQSPAPAPAPPSFAPSITTRGTPEGIAAAKAYNMAHGFGDSQGNYSGAGTPYTGPGTASYVNPGNPAGSGGFNLFNPTPYVAPTTPAQQRTTTGDAALDASYGVLDGAAQGALTAQGITRHTDGTYWSAAGPVSPTDIKKFAAAIVGGTTPATPATPATPGVTPATPATPASPGAGNTALGNTAIATAGAPLAAQQQSTGLFNTLAAGTPAIQDYYKRYYQTDPNSQAMPTFSQQRALSPTQVGVQSAMNSANQIDETDWLDSIARQFQGFSPNRSPGQQAQVGVM